jgi:hypothetical protein
MNKPTLSSNSGTSSSYLDKSQSRQYFARLMTPSEVASATVNRPLEVRQRTAGHWVLAGDISSEMFKLLGEAPALNFPMRLSGFSSTAGVGYCSLVHQVQRHQSRIVLPLYDASSRMFLEAMTKSEHLTFMLGNDGSGEALLLNSPVGPMQYMPLLALSCPATPQQQHEALRELPILQEIMGNPLQVPSLLPEYSVQHVNVSLLLPSVLNDCFQAALAKAARP